MEDGSWKIRSEIKKCRKQDPETGKVNLEVRNWSPKIEGMRGPGIRVLYRPDSPGSPGETLFKYIRSGPEGARGVSDG